MLFNSYPFFFAFLPLTLVLFLIIRRFNYPIFINILLIAASLFFYAWWNPKYLVLLIFSIVFNYSIAILINKTWEQPWWRKVILIIGISGNLLLLGYFKYAGFFAKVVNELSGSQLDFGNIVLPLGISFFTLQQVSYLIDAYRGKPKNLVSSHTWLRCLSSPTSLPVRLCVTASCSRNSPRGLIKKLTISLIWRWV